MKDMELGETNMKEKLNSLRNENSGYTKRISEMNSMLTSLLIQLTKIKDEHVSMK
jgi:hypothetical protein